jgi:phage I-like protein
MMDKAAALIRLDEPSDNDHLGYLVDLQGVGFNDGDNTTWIQAMPLGKWRHPVHGVIEITAERVQKFADGVKNKIRGQDLPIDYDHREKDNKAAGWVQNAEARADGLWLLVEWTQAARDAIKKREYRYFSPEFARSWTHPSSGEKYSDVLFGGGITNRPFLKGILPINLSEVFDDQGGSTEMDPKLRAALIKRFKLSEDATEEQILQAAEDAGTQNEGGTPQPQPTVQATEPDDEALTKLAEDHPAVAALLESNKALAKTVGTLETNFRLNEANGIIGSVSQGEHALPVALHDDARYLLSETPSDFATKFKDFLVKLHETGTVELGERGTGGDNSGANDPVKRYEDEIKKLMEDDKMSYPDAVEQVALAEPALFEAYRVASFSREEV